MLSQRWVVRAGDTTRPRRKRARLAGVTGAGALLVAGLPAVAAHAQVEDILQPAAMGAWTMPFEEGGAGQPRCADDGTGAYVCKVSAVTMSVLPDGRVLYYNGIEAQENNDQGLAWQYGNRSRDSQTRLLDVRSGTPEWSTPSPDRGAGGNPNIRPGQKSTDDPMGMAGAPGQPGEGPVGSAWGEAGLPPQAPSSPPDDPSENDGDLFCGDVTLLPDGRLLTVGGTDFYNEPSVMDKGEGDPADLGLIELEGLRSANAFDPATDTFSLTSPMKFGRWYPGVVGMPDGKVLVAGGTTKVIKNTQGGHVRRTETFDPQTDIWAENYVSRASESSLPQAPRLNLMPDGKVYYIGVGHMNSPFFGPAADEALFSLQQRYDPAAKTWEIVGPAPLGAVSNGFQIMLPLAPPYAKADLLAFGGTLGPPPSGYVGVPFATVTSVDRSGAVTNKVVESMHQPRWYPSGVLLPDGTVVALGGGDVDDIFTPGVDKPTLTTEVFDPRTGKWTETAPNGRGRDYHASAVLLPDMRVLFGGHSPIGTLYGPQRNSDLPSRGSNEKDPSFEVWSPPYLFRGPRPTITHAPAGIAWGQAFDLKSPQATDIESVALIRLGSAQHANDGDQRMLYLDFTREGDQLRALAPPDGVVAPPGHYYLVVNRSTEDGPVPSVARIVRVGADSDTAEAPKPFPDGGEAPSGGSATDLSHPSIPKKGLASPNQPSLQGSLADRWSMGLARRRSATVVAGGRPWRSAHGMPASWRAPSRLDARPLME